MDILAVEGDEGRLLENDMLREVLKYTLTRRFPNEVTPLSEMVVTPK